MEYCDYHLHSEFSFDSTETIDNICRKAIEMKIREIVLTDHVEFGTEDGNVWPDFNKREMVLEQCRKQYGTKLQIKSGVETGQPQRNLLLEKKFFEDNKFDFVISSIHVVGDTGRPSKYEFTEQNYFSYFEQYFAESKELADKGNYDVVGHVTFPFRYVPVEILQKYPIELFKKDYMELFEIIAGRNKGIEINTSGLRTNLQATMPSLEIVKWFKECGGRIVTIGSDGHSVRSAFSGLEEGYRVLQIAGFESQCFFLNRAVSMTPL